jgi:Lrp/AsnC family transcriptional regulator, leucine-responsive regulatory protein
MGGRGSGGGRLGLCNCKIAKRAKSVKSLSQRSVWLGRIHQNLLRTTDKLSAYNSDVVADIRISLDPVDLQILEHLQTNARNTQADIARAIGLAPSGVLERIRKLESKGVIRGYTANVDPKIVGLGMLAFVAVRSDEVASDEHVARDLSETPEVLEVHHVAGEDCYLVKVRCRDAEHLGQLLRTRIGRIKGVRSTRSTIVLETVKETSRLPLPAREGAKS